MNCGLKSHSGADKLNFLHHLVQEHDFEAACLTGLAWVTHSVDVEVVELTLLQVVAIEFLDGQCSGACVSCYDWVGIETDT